MKLPLEFARKALAPCLSSLLLVPVAQAQSQANMPSTEPPSQTSSTPNTSTQGASTNQSQGQDNGSAQTPLTQPTTNQQGDESGQPVGTAVAPAEKTLAATASRPAGAAIAPAKQRRARSIVIRVGIVVGACVAVGTIVALSHGSPSTPH